MTWFAPAVGAVLIASTLRDMFHRLWHPSGDGTLSERVIRGVWRAARWAARHGRSGGMSGPLAIVVVIVMWALLLIAGFGLVYWPYLDEGFVLSSGLDSAGRSDLLDALYLSLVTLGTLGFGDIVPAEGWLRVLVPLEAFAGFALFTAAVSWALQVYPVVGRRRALALRLAVLERSDGDREIAAMDSSSAAEILHQLAIDMAHVRVDLHQYGETYYFREKDPSLALPDHLRYTLRLADSGAGSARSDVRYAARMLRASVDDLAVLLAGRLTTHAESGTEAVLDAYASDHGSR